MGAHEQNSNRLLAACDHFEKFRWECLRCQSPMLVSDYVLALNVAALVGQAHRARRYFECLCLSERDVVPRIGLWELFCRAIFAADGAQICLKCFHSVSTVSIHTYYTWE